MGKHPSGLGGCRPRARQAETDPHPCPEWFLAVSEELVAHCPSSPPDSQTWWPQPKTARPSSTQPSRFCANTASTALTSTGSTRRAGGAPPQTSSASPPWCRSGWVLPAGPLGEPGLPGPAGPCLALTLCRPPGAGQRLPAGSPALGEGAPPPERGRAGGGAARGRWVRGGQNRSVSLGDPCSLGGGARGGLSSPGWSGVAPGEGFAKPRPPALLTAPTRPPLQAPSLALFPLPWELGLNVKHPEEKDLSSGCRGSARRGWGVDAKDASCQVPAGMTPADWGLWSMSPVRAAMRRLAPHPFHAPAGTWISSA